MSLKSRLHEWLAGSDASREGEGGRTGAFSYAGEWHAFFLGIALGFASFTPSPSAKRFVYDAIEYDIHGSDSRKAAMREIRKESWYGYGGFFVGAVVALVLQAAVLALTVWGLQLGVTYALLPVY